MLHRTSKWVFIKSHRSLQSQTPKLIKLFRTTGFPALNFIRKHKKPIKFKKN